MLAIVEVHDVSPYYYDEFCKCLELLSLTGISKFSLLVIPNFRDSYPIYRYPGFVNTLHYSKQEIIMHGYNHTSRFKLKEALYTYGEGEMGGLTLQEVYKKIESAIDIFQIAKLNTSFFVSPAWISNPFLEDVLSSFGFLGVGYRKYLKNIENNHTVPSRVITFSSRKVLSYLSTKVLLTVYKLIKDDPVLRLALHMKDFSSKKKIALWRLLLKEIKNSRRLVSYGELLGKSGSSPSLQGFQSARWMV